MFLIDTLLWASLENFKMATQIVAGNQKISRVRIKKIIRKKMAFDSIGFGLKLLVFDGPKKLVKQVGEIQNDGSKITVKTSILSIFVTKNYYTSEVRFAKFKMIQIFKKSNHVITQFSTLLKYEIIIYKIQLKVQNFAYLY